MYFFIVVLSVFILVDLSFGGISNTPHNLSITGTGNIKAVSETEICAFCHIPHNEKEGTPLWNRKMPVSVYTLFDSEFLSRINYPSPQQPSEVEGQPGIVSRQCLSCHDGTVAIGDIYIIRGTELGNQIIQMQNVNPDGTMPSTATGYIGTDLSVHHPVAIEYNPDVRKDFDIGTKTVELKSLPDSPIKLYTYSGKKYVECTSCHDPHKENKKFLRVDVGNLAHDFKQTCISCHDKPGWTGSAHDTQAVVYTDPEVIQKYGEGSPVSVADLGCGNCHTPHKAQGRPLLRKVEENTCFTGAGASSSVAPCHGSGGAKDIQSLLPPNNMYGHPVTDSSLENVHTPLDILYGYGSNETDPANSRTIKFSDSKHAECMDCHNPHSVKPGTHVSQNQWYPQSSSPEGNNVSQPLSGVYGVEPVWGSLWTQPSQFQTLYTASKEYQICMKCHSRWALGDSPNMDCTTSEISSQSGIVLTDQSCEFSPNNKSAHPVVMPLNQMTGNYDPKSLSPDQLKPPWNSNPGNQTMYCSDCHGNDNETANPKGPHGSQAKFMLKGPNKNWPADENGRLYKVGDIFGTSSDGGTTDGLFCVNCHNLENAEVHQFKGNGGCCGGMGGGGMGGGFADFPCVYCHVAVPHGSPVSRLIGYSNFPEPYNYMGNSLKLDGFVKNNILQKWDAHSNSFTCRCHRMGMGGGNYDPNPYPY
ncbi:doubled CXXCH domain-containing protein [Persephonella hydrogeniphila]|uniref:Doubled CXXCH domain-containing protein n=1 Tax=Persephonella hydrogeniphila TaxID=198703 RepID=A0A285NNM4_9AQUI|nr:cytochrome c3 family protein [Persephonella hydrogeniphila]SNZ11049.1 doubled CXXCH domain-containing protein [Persephonella hydrogeniphila]